MTMQRRLILEALARARHHTTAEEIARYVRAKNPEIDASTVYRNLEALEAIGAVTHTHIDGRVTRWHRADVERHGHLVCRQCGREEEVELADIQPLERKLQAEHGFRADLAHSAILGICARCDARSREAG
ncbi:MAG: transcriptional repressor [Chloroflexota bacterium]|nr:transcriptional repressor [Chloroflexota bacterium]